VIRAGRWHVGPTDLGVLLVGAEVLVRVVAGGPYPGATMLLVLACGVSTVPFLPPALDSAILRAAVVPAAGIVAFAVLLTTVSIVGVHLGEVSIRLAVAGFVVTLGALARARSVSDRRPPRRMCRREAYAAVALGVVVLWGLASGWDVVGPFPPGGVDWGHYLLYADEVEAQRALLIDDPYAGEKDRLFADGAGIGALYGGARILDGISSESLSPGIVVISVLSVLSVFAAAGALWGLRAGLFAAALWGVAPIRIDPIRWYGLGTNLGLIYVPLVLLALALLYRGARGGRIVAFLGASLLGVAVMHSTSAFVVGFFVAAALAVECGRQVVRHGPHVAAWWRDGIFASVLAALAGAALAGAGVLAHLRAQAADLGSPVSFRMFEPDWLSWRVIVDYYSLAFLLLGAASVVAVLMRRELRRDSAFLAILSLVVACVVVGELWRLEIPFEYRRVVYYAGIAVAMLVGAVAPRIVRDARLWTLGALLVLVYIGHASIGLRLPERLLRGAEPKGTAAATIRRFAESLAGGEVRDASVVVADRCHNFVVPYLLRRPTIVAFEPWQVGFESRVPLARKAAAILEGGAEGRRLARSLDVGYVVANPTCTPNLPSRLGGSVVVDTPDVVVMDIRRSER
jgi:hypothetical protein